MFGGNDAQGIVGPDGTVYSSVSETGWQAEYGRRVGAVMDSLQGEGRLVLWVGQPPMRDAGFNDRVDILNSVYEEQAADRPWVRYVDVDTVLGADGESAARLPAGAGGQTDDLRPGAGIHLTPARSATRRAGNEGVRPGSSRWWP